MMANAIELGDVRERLGVYLAFLSVAHKEELYVRAILEGYEGSCVTRAHDPRFSPDRTLLSVLITPQFVPDVRELLSALLDDADLEVVQPTPELCAAVARELSM